MKSSASCPHGKRGPRKGHVGPNGMTHCVINSGPQGLAFGDSLEAARRGRLVGASAGRGRRETESLVSVSQNTRHRAHRSRAARDCCLAFTTGRGTETICRVSRSAECGRWRPNKRYRLQRFRTAAPRAVRILCSGLLSAASGLGAARLARLKHNCLLERSIRPSATIPWLG